MWMLDNQTPFKAERTWVRDWDGKHQWIVVIKAAYDISNDGSLRFADEQLEPLYAPVYMGADLVSSLRYEADLIAMKPATDVYLNAVAFAPRGKPSTSVKVTFKIDGLSKELIVYGNRTWQRSLSGSVIPSSPKEFVKMPVIYENAFGGYDKDHSDLKKHLIDSRNPIGTGIAISKKTLIGNSAPTIEYLDKKHSKTHAPGFGAIASYWSPRKEFAGTYDEQWEAKRKPLLPEDYNSLFLMCSPTDQRLEGYLQGGELIELTNLTLTGRLCFVLPKLSFTFDTYFGSGCRSHSSELVSVIIESEGPRLIMVWQTSLICSNDGEYLDKTIIKQVEQQS